MISPVITIDGPVASGKGTVARMLAERLGFHLLDSGAIYRAHAQACLKRKIEVNEINKLEEQAKVLSLKFVGEDIWLDGVDATAAVRSETVGMAASTLSAIPQVRAALMQRQRDFAQMPGLVADGRDMGTVVFPDAALKIYLTATAQVRAERRAGQVAMRRLAGGEQMDAKLLIEKGKSPTIDNLPETIQAQVQLGVEDELRRDVERQIRLRDTQDKSRAVAPLQPAVDAIVIDNANHSPEETVDVVLSLWNLRCH
jgi:cytidylate kinase